MLEDNGLLARNVLGERVNARVLGVLGLDDLCEALDSPLSVHEQLDDDRVGPDVGRDVLAERKELIRALAYFVNP